MKCPVCKKDEFSSEEMGDGLAALRCDECQGHWLPSFVYWKWLSRRGHNAPEILGGADNPQPKSPPKGGRLCPDCGRILIKYRVKKGVPFTVDRCGNCAGLWLDQGEWAYLKKRNLHDDLDYIFTAVWQTRIRKEDSADAAAESLAKALGPADFKVAKKIRVWLDQHPLRSRILAYLTGSALCLALLVPSR
ncbi:MAG: zf-TFIIB domain-containing protein [Elusimicrobia bacterium]|nr:zf-TFIIB domain-containing protein [Elusimicrobiota bacterium]